MVNIQASIAVDLSGLEKFREQIESQINHRSTGPITKAFNQWVARYRSFIKERFDIYSKGGGNWAPLSEKTKAQRRKPKPKKRKSLKHVAVNNRTGRAKIKTGRKTGRATPKKATGKARGLVSPTVKGRKFTILRDTGTLFAATSPTPGKPGAVSQEIAFGMRVGFGGSAGHPKGKATIASIAMFHQTGAGHLPVREIIVQPDVACVTAMTGYMQRAVDSLAKE
jgi:hypothetical protein